jgi:hypothetical protein
MMQREQRRVAAANRRVNRRENGQESQKGYCPGAFSETNDPGPAQRPAGVDVAALLGGLSVSHSEMTHGGFDQ